MKKLCGRCQAIEFRRLNRTGFMERKVLPMFEIYPWECALCRRKVYLRMDGRKGAGSPQTSMVAALINRWR